MPFADELKQKLGHDPVLTYQYVPGAPGEKSCPPVWDTFACWPSAGGGTLVTRSCRVLLREEIDTSTQLESTGSYRDVSLGIRRYRQLPAPSLSRKRVFRERKELFRSSFPRQSDFSRLGIEENRPVLRS